jgi:ribosomal protein L32
MADRIPLPNPLRLLGPRLRQILRRAAPGPFRPPRHVTVSYRIVMHVIQRRPVMPVRTALRARRRERKLFTRAIAPGRSKCATCGHAAIPAHATDLLYPALPPARDNDSATRTTQMSGPRTPRTRPADRTKNCPCAPGYGQCNDDAQNTMPK